MSSSQLWFSHISIFLLFSLLFFTASVNGAPLTTASDPKQDYPPDSLEQANLLKRNDNVSELRILPLGASITWGLHSQSGNGYRKPLRDLLVHHGWKVDMVGSKHHGDMKDDAVEAHSGDVITKVQEAAKNSLHYKPNLVLINAGTNDCRLNLDIKNTGKRMRALIESILKADGMENTAIVLSTLIPSVQNQTAAHRPAVNDQYRHLVTAMRKEGMPIVLADMDPPAPADDSGWFSWPADYTVNGKADSTHPNDHGYSKMACVWFKAIKEAYDQRLIKRVT